MRLITLSFFAAACATATAPTDSGGDPVDTADTADTAAEVTPPPEFDRFCNGRDWQEGAETATIPERNETPRGYVPDHTGYMRGTVEASKFIPTHPFHVTRMRVMFAEGDDTARLRLMGTQGRSYPASYPDLDAEGATLAGPFDVEVSTAWGDNEWTEIDLSDQDVWLLPGQHYTLVNEYPRKGAPTVAYSATPTGDTSRALLIVAGQDEPYGLPGDYEMEVEGEYFCQWPAEDRWFSEWTTPFQDDPTGNVAMADLNGDGHTDVVTYGKGPEAWLGDGKGGFSGPTNPWPDAAGDSWLLFGDVDNDGDEDAFAASYVGADNDGDGFTIAEGDCNDADIAVYPGATEVDNALDDDCDLVADAGTDTTDADADGVTILDGDCDDTDDTMLPGGMEVRDSLDNDCDGQVDEDFPSRILLNDGTGQFAAIPAGLEVTEPSTAGAFADANGDGALDVYFGNWLEHYPDNAAVPGRYYTGVGDGTFVDQFDAAGLRMPEAFSTYGFEWTDYNNDGWPDALVGNYHLYDNQLWENQGDGTFVDVAPAKHVDHDEIPTEQASYPGGHSYGGDFGDIDNDGDMDYFQSNLCHPRTYPWADQSTLNINGGAPDFEFTNEAHARGLEYDEGDVQGVFGDYDNDMDLDLLVSSLYPNHYPRVYQNDGTGHFTDVTYEVGLDAPTSFGIAWADIDEDGDLDLFSSSSYGDHTTHLLENKIGTQNHWVELKLEGTTTNRDAAGARVTLVAGGVTQLRDVQAGGGSFNQQRPLDVHFGLAGNTSVTSVTVHWVGGGTETFTGVGADHRWLLVEGAGAAAPR